VQNVGSGNTALRHLGGHLRKANFCEPAF